MDFVYINQFNQYNQQQQPQNTRKKNLGKEAHEHITQIKLNTQFEDDHDEADLGITWW